MIRLKLSTLPPTVNGMYANVRGKGRVKTKRYKEWCSSAGWEIKKQAAGKIHSEKYGLIIKVHRRENGDYSNYIKPIEDLLVTLGVTPDDRHNMLPLAFHNEESGVDITVLDVNEAKELKEMINNFEKDLDY